MSVFRLAGSMWNRKIWASRRLFP